MKILFQIIINLFLLSIVECGFFSSAVDKLKNKAKAAYRRKNAKGPTLNFLGQVESEYPGANNKYRDENRALWNEYYECLNSQSKNINDQKTVIPEAIIGFKTSFVKMECKICLSPIESKNKESITWEWAGPNDEVLSPIEYTEHILLSPDDASLQIFNLNDENSGQYMCILGDSIVTPYFLTVVNISEDTINQVHSRSSPVGPYPKSTQETRFDLILDTEWGEWSTCSKCNNVGRKHKFGYCNVYRKQPGTNESEKITAEEKITNLIKRSTDEEIQKIFEIFKYGIPCQSHILPSIVRELPEVQSRKNEIMAGYCNVKCPETKVFEVRDKEGNVIEQANNSAGIYSLSQALPPMEPAIERRLQYEAKGQDIILECPGNVDSDAPIQWQIGDKNLIAETISKQSNGRIYISITDRIHINKAKISDSNIYSCWQQKELAGTIRLAVEKRFELNFNHTIMLFGIVLIMGTFLYIFIKVIANKGLTKT